MQIQEPTQHLNLEPQCLCGTFLELSLWKAQIDSGLYNPSSGNYLQSYYNPAQRPDSPRSTSARPWEKNFSITSAGVVLKMGHFATNTSEFILLESLFSWEWCPGIRKMNYMPIE